MVFIRLIFTAAIDYKNIFTVKILNPMAIVQLHTIKFITIIHTARFFNANYIIVYIVSWNRLSVYNSSKRSCMVNVLSIFLSPKCMDASLALAKFSREGGWSCSSPLRYVIMSLALWYAADPRGRHHGRQTIDHIDYVTGIGNCSREQ